MSLFARLRLIKDHAGKRFRVRKHLESMKGFTQEKGLINGKIVIHNIVNSARKHSPNTVHYKSIHEFMIRKSHMLVIGMVVTRHSLKFLI